MSQLTALVVLLPLISGIAILLARPMGIRVQRLLNVVLVIGLLALSILAYQTASDGVHRVVLLGNWPAPYGIAIVLDRLSSLMILLTALLALAALCYAIANDVDKQGEHFHVLFQLQLFGLNGAFMTGDLFNLFVFFEVLLIASYGLLLHGGGRLRTAAGLHYVVINLVGSTLFLFAVGTLYGMLGTLNIADMARAVRFISSDDQSIIATAALLLLVVFGIKAAMFPLYLWLPRSYSNACAPVAALFAIMTKVGLYAIIRVHGTIFGESAGELAFIHSDWVLMAGLATLVLGALGVMAATILREQFSYLILASVATLMIAIGLNNQLALGSTIYYLIHSTVVGAATFLVADVILRGRGDHADALIQGQAIDRAPLIGAAFMVLAIASTGMPPLSGFFGKVMIIDAALEHPWYIVILIVILLSSLIMIISMTRSGSLLFYNVKPNINNKISSSNKLAYASIILLISVSPLMVVFAKHISMTTQLIAIQIYNVDAYSSAVLDFRPVRKVEE